MTHEPSKGRLNKVERALKGSEPGRQLVVSEGVYMRLDKSGRRRFLARARSGGRQTARTYDSWAEADAAREELAAADPGTADDTVTSMQMRYWSVERYALEAWWELHVLVDLDISTQSDYERGLQDLLPLVRGVKMIDLIASPLLVDQIRAKAKKAKTYKKAGQRKAQLYAAAADKIVYTLRKICSHAVKKRVLPFNPLIGAPRFNAPRGAAPDGERPGHRRVLESEIFRPRKIALVGSGMRGKPLELLRRRLIPWLIAIGLRPSDIMAMRDFWWRDLHGPRERLLINAAVKDIRGHLFVGEPKTGRRDPILFHVVAEWLEAIYQLKGGGGLDPLTFPNRNGGLRSWGNWRDDVWYQSMHRAGVIDSPSAAAQGAFDPYACRHIGLSIMLHAQRPEGGTYSRHEVAEQFGNTPATLDRVYGRTLPDLYGVAGLTMDEIIRRAMRDVWVRCQATRTTS